MPLCCLRDPPPVHCPKVGNLPRCSSSSTSATPRRTSAPSAARSSSSTGASPPCATSTADELGAALANLLELRGLTFDDLDASIVSTVVPQLEPEYEAHGRRATSATTCSLVGPGLKTGMPIRIDNPRELGADRLVNAVAALRPLPRRRASSSTSAPSINYDVVSAEGEYLGGIIAPGVEISHRRADQRAAQARRGSTSSAPRAVDRQVDRRRGPLRRRLRLRRPGRRHRRAHPRRAGARARARSPPAASPSSSSRTARRSTRSTTCSRCTGLRLLLRAQCAA